MAVDHKSEAGTARFAFFSKRETVFDAIEKGELPKKVWRREFASAGRPAISYAQFMRLFNKFAPAHLQALLGNKAAAGADGRSTVERPVAIGPGVPTGPSPLREPISSNSQPQRKLTHGRLNRTPYKFGDLKIDLNEVYGPIPEKKSDR